MIKRAGCPDSEALVSFLYDELDGSEGVDRRTLQRHTESCERCAAEVASFGGVRQALREWAEPEMALGFRVVADAPRRGWLSNLGLPSWAVPALPLAAAAVIVLGAALGLARLDVQYDANGFRLRTGWGSDAASVQSTTAAATTAGVSLAPPGARTAAATAGATPISLAPPPAPAATPNAPWRTDLAALERQMRQEMVALRRSGTAGDAIVTAASHLDGDPSNASSADQTLLRRIQQLIDQSEVRQQQNLALRAAELSRDFDLQRRTDLVRIEQGFGRLADQREQDAQQQRVLLNSIRVSQPPQ